MPGTCFSPRGEHTIDSQSEVDSTIGIAIEIAIDIDPDRGQSAGRQAKEAARCDTMVNVGVPGAAEKHVPANPHGRREYSRVSVILRHVRSRHVRSRHVTVNTAPTPFIV